MHEHSITLDTINSKMFLDTGSFRWFNDQNRSHGKKTEPKKTLLENTVFGYMNKNLSVKILCCFTKPGIPLFYGFYLI